MGMCECAERGLMASWAEEKSLRAVMLESYLKEYKKVKLARPVTQQMKHHKPQTPSMVNIPFDYPEGDDQITEDSFSDFQFDTTNDFQETLRSPRFDNYDIASVKRIDLSQVSQEDERISFNDMAFDEYERYRITASPLNWPPRNIILDQMTGEDSERGTYEPILPKQLPPSSAYVPQPSIRQAEDNVDFVKMPKLKEGGLKMLANKIEKELLGIKC